MSQTRSSAIADAFNVVGANPFLCRHSVDGWTFLLQCEQNTETIMEAEEIRETKR